MEHDTGTPQPELRSISRSTLRIVGLIAGATLIFLFAVLLSRKIWSYTISTYLTNKLHDELLLDQNLAKAIASLIWIPFVYFLAQSISLIGKRKRLVGAIGLSAYSASFALGSYYVQRDVYFTDEGPAKFVAITSEGCEFSEEDGVHPKTGVSRRPVTKTIVEACKGSEGFSELESIPMLYDVETGEPLVWYVNTDGVPRYFLSPGYDSRTGVERQRLTREAMALIRDEVRERQEQVERERARAAERTRADELERLRLQTEADEARARADEAARARLGGDAPATLETAAANTSPTTGASQPVRATSNATLSGRWRLTKTYSLSTCPFELPSSYTLFLSGDDDRYRLAMEDDLGRMLEYHTARLRGRELSVDSWEDIRWFSDDRMTFNGEFRGMWNGSTITGTEKINMVNDCFMEATWHATKMN